MAKPSFKSKRPFRPADSGRPPRPQGTIPTPSVGKALMLYGVHAVTSAWLNPERNCRHLYGTPPALEAFAAVIEAANRDSLTRPPAIAVDRDTIERMLPPGAVHQGLALDSEPLPEVGLEDVLIAGGDGPMVLVLLDQVTDPHNVGAIMRSAAAFGAKGVIVQSRNAPEISGVLAKSASGAVDVLPMLSETNLSRSIERLREEGFFVAGLAEDGEADLSAVEFGDRVVLALGAEGEGLRRLVAEHCTALVKLPTQPPIGSLNVSNAAAVGLYEIARRRTR